MGGLCQSLGLMTGGKHTHALTYLHSMTGTHTHTYRHPREAVRLAGAVIDSFIQGAMWLNMNMNVPES